MDAFICNTRIAVAFARWNFFVVVVFEQKQKKKFQMADATATRVCCKKIRPISLLAFC